MKTIEIKVYEFNELSDDAKQVALEQFADINVDHQWWDFTYDDAKTVGIKITGFNLDRGNYIKGELIFDACDTANKILKEHGETCDTYKVAGAFLSNYDAIIDKYYNIDTEEGEGEGEGEGSQFNSEIDELKSEFEENILDAYLQILKDEFDYLTSKEAIIETILSNEYEFLESGKLN